MTRPPFAASPFFAFRTPLLPFETVEALAAGARSPAALDSAADLDVAVEADAEAQRGRLRDLVTRPDVREAIFLASPDLEQAIDGWLVDPRSDKGRRAERALVKYVMRMASRATPFGLFAGTAVGGIGRETQLTVGPRARLRRRSRLDADWLFALADAFGETTALRHALTYRPNSSLYGVGARWRYVETRRQGSEKSHHLVSVEDSPEIRAVLRRAEGGARLAELAEVVVGEDVSRDEAETFVSELVEAQLLVPATGLVLTGSDSLAGFAEALRGDPSTVPAAEALEEAERRLGQLDAGGPGAAPESYRRLAAALAGLPVEPVVSRLFQVDLVDPASIAMLGEKVVGEIGRGVELLHRLMPPRGSDLRDFVEAFEERWGQREVPLGEVLDEDSGIGYPVFAEEDSSSSPLLEGLPFPEATSGTTRWGRREAHLLRLLYFALSAGQCEIVLSDSDVQELANPSPVPLPGAFAALVKVASPSTEALSRGDFRLVFESAGGPSGARFLGRFGHADPELARLTNEHLRAEEALDPDAVFAEVVHLPEGRSGNVVRRPVFRDYEIPYLGESGAPADGQIPVADLLVSVRAGEVVLRSKRLGRRVVPRQTAAHNYVAYGLGIYRFLCALQAQSTAGGVLWDWGALSRAPFLPRIRRGRTILSCARWNLGRDEIAGLVSPKSPAERFRAVSAWRRERRLPRFVLVADLAEELLVDLEAVLSVEAFLHLARGEDQIELKEMLPAPDELCARGSGGRFVHEALVPYLGTCVRRGATGARGRVFAGVSEERCKRSFVPGSDWLYLKLYGGNASLERLLRERIGPLATRLTSEGETDRWFFVRYADPRPHLRIRFYGCADRLREALVPALRDEAEASIREGLAWRLQLDTYDREIERYGGEEGIELAERAFHADSEAVVELLGMLEEGGAGEEERWRLGLLGADLLLADLGFSTAERLALSVRLRHAFGSELGEDATLRRALADAFRRRGQEATGLLSRDADAVRPLLPGLAVLDRRSERLSGIGRSFRELAAAGRLTMGLEGIAASFVHMHLNRLFPAAQRRQEMVLHDLLSRALAGMAARRSGDERTGEGNACP